MDILDRLAKSKFRSRFKLRAKELKYIKDKGLDTIRSHACDFIRDRVAPLNLQMMANKPQCENTRYLSLSTQPPPVAAAVSKNGISSPQHRELTQSEQEYLVSIIMEWINRQINSNHVL